MTPRILRGAALAAAAAIAAAGCGSSASPSPSAAASATVASSLTPGASASAAASPVSASPTGLPVAIDPTLLGVLPETVENQSLAESPDAEQSDVESLGSGSGVDRLAVAIVILPISTASDPGPTAITDDQLATASVVALKSGTYSETFFKEWRTSFDESVCAQAGGVTSASTQTTIAGRSVWTATCAGGVTTYHIRVSKGDLLISIMSIGSHQLGRQIVQGLRTQ